MPLYVRRYPCAICGKPVYWDSDRQKLTCGCGSFHHTFVNLKVFTPVPKYDRKIWKETITLPIDSAKFLELDNKTLAISDRNSIFKGNEHPQATLKWIYYPKGDKIQVTLEISGSFHGEKLAYNQKDPHKWKGRIWIRFSSEIIPRIIEFLERDPNKLASWM